jgi:hypothetical protein
MEQKIKYNTGFFLLLIIFIFPIHLACAETYHLEIEENAFDVEYELKGDVIAMAADKESISLLIATENVLDSQFKIKLPNELIRAENNEFAVLVNGFEVDYSVINKDNTQLTFFIPAFTEEIEIIGTYVVPEFSLGPILIFGAISGIILLIEKSKKIFFR